jgi:hypothetical protein
LRLQRPRELLDEPAVLAAQRGGGDEQPDGSSIFHGVHLLEPGIVERKEAGQDRLPKSGNARVAHRYESVALDRVVCILWDRS